MSSRSCRARNCPISLGPSENFKISARKSTIRNWTAASPGWRLGSVIGIRGLGSLLQAGEKGIEGDGQDLHGQAHEFTRLLQGGKGHGQQAGIEVNQIGRASCRERV